MAGRRSFIGFVLVTATFGLATAAGAHHGEVPDDVDLPPVIQVPEGLLLRPAAALYGWEPLGIVAGEEVRDYSLGTDRWAVWVCDLPDPSIGVTASGATTFLNSVVAPHYDWLSEDAYSMVFVNGGTVSASTESGCVDEAFDRTQPGDVTGGIIIADAQLGYGLGGPGFVGGPTSFPANARYVFMGGESVVQTGPWPDPIASLVTHEIGHGISWPHSYTGETSIGGQIWEYDNPIDLMSGNTDSGFFATETASYATLAFNRYAAGWIDPSDVVVHSSGTRELVLNAVGSGGVEMVVIPLGTEGHLVTLDARVPSDNDPIPSSWQGVSAHTIDQRDTGGCFTSFVGACFGLDRRTSQAPAEPDAIDHVIGVGGSATLGGVQVAVIAREGDGFRIRLEGTAVAGGFLDTAGSPFVADIEWLADTGITKGCNPPANDRFCPDETVTRGQMAAFLVRALGLTDSGGITFDDTGATTFETDIARLATVGITRGCNPPANDRFCPDDPVTRGQMAAFLVRAFGLTDSGGIAFEDTGGTTFETDIARLAAAGITRGCTTADFCPNDPVTRGQMAAFLHRAEDYLP